MPATTHNRVYLAGPMRGYEDWNREVFRTAQARWRAAGWQVFSPAHILPLMDHEPDQPGRDHTCRTHLLQAIQIDLACLYAADAIALLPGWERSVGATVELAVAQFLGLEVYDAETLTRIDPPTCPWAGVPRYEREPGQDGDWGDVWRALPQIHAQRPEVLR